MEYFVFSVIGFVALVDWLLLPKRSRNSLKFLFLLSVIGLVVMYSRGSIASLLKNLGFNDPLEGAVFLLFFLLLRELLISRSRQFTVEEQMTRLVRESAIREAKER